ncbi:unnamed protein product [Nesidiocoris tenuis]|uniref:MH2 domain-containing protein n=1 Tax=Nesidiocoris tenuis TaxID=355587 RepID=A0A6H5FWT6_9HEMI|nr:unnamed protein product [Nesidiocoris tenuis]
MKPGQCWHEYFEKLKYLPSLIEKQESRNFNPSSVFSQKLGFQKIKNWERTVGRSPFLFSPHGKLKLNLEFKNLFDMKKFQANVNRELRRAYPDRRRLECQCLSALAFVKSEQDLLDCPIWVLIINVVAMDMLKSKLPPVTRSAVDIRNRPRIPVPDEDPYSVASNGGGSGSSGASSGGGSVHQGPPSSRRSDKPPKLPPRDSNHNPYPHHIPKPDYDDIEEDENSIAPQKNFPSSRSKDKSKDNSKHDDPYYCGLRARVPNFVKTKNGKVDGKLVVPPPGGRFVLPPGTPAAHLGLHHLHHHAPHHPHMWHARSYDSGMDSEFIESPYNHIYGRLPIPTRGYIPPSPRTMYIGEWD